MDSAIGQDPPAVHWSIWTFILQVLKLTWPDAVDNW